jgi:transposase
MSLKGDFIGRKYKEYNMNQSLIISPDIHDWIPRDHFIYLIAETVDQLDLSNFYHYYERDGSGVGQPPMNPTMMVNILFYGYATGRQSSRKIETACVEDVAFRILSGGQFPNFRTISEFRRIHLDRLADIFVQVVKICQDQGLVKLDLVAIDGTKVKANASLDTTKTYKTLKKQEDELEKKIREMLKQGIDIDEEEDRLYGEDKRGDELPKGLRNKQDRLKRIKESIRRIEEKKEEEAKAQEEKIRKREQEEKETGKKKRGRKPKEPNPIPDNKDKGNTTDPDSHIQKTQRKEWMQGYTAESAVDEEFGIVVAASVTNECNDMRQLDPMLTQVEQNTGRIPDAAVLDNGFNNLDQMKMWDKKLNLLVATGNRHKTGEDKTYSDTEMGEWKEYMDGKLSTEEGKKMYGKRAPLAEGTFGIIKHTMGIRGFLLRGLKKVDPEWKIINTAHNLRKMWTARKQRGVAVAFPTG